MFGGRRPAVRRHPSCGRSLNGSTFNDRNRTGYAGRMRRPVFRRDRHLSRPLVGRVEDDPAKWESHSATYTFARNRATVLYLEPVRRIVARFFRSKRTRPPAELRAKSFVRVSPRAANRGESRRTHSTAQHRTALRSHPPFPPLLFESRSFPTDVDNLRGLFFQARPANT